MTTYIDMDGVLADLRGQFRSDAELIAAVPGMSQQDWADLPKTQACDWWIKLLDRPTVLTKCTTLAAYKGKVDWIQKHLPYGWHVICIGGSKARWALPGDILYDDYHRNVSEWNEAGGIGVLCDTLTGYPINIYTETLT